MKPPKKPCDGRIVIQKVLVRILYNMAFFVRNHHNAKVFCGSAKVLFFSCERLTIVFPFRVKSLSLCTDLRKSLARKKNPFCSQNYFVVMKWERAGDHSSWNQERCRGWWVALVFVSHVSLISDTNHHDQWQDFWSWTLALWVHKGPTKTWEKVPEAVAVFSAERFQDPLLRVRRLVARFDRHDTWRMVTAIADGSREWICKLRG